MPKREHSELVTGLFVLVALALGLGVVAWLGAAEVFGTKGQLVSFYMLQSDGSIGLTDGSDVTYCDASIGRIVAIEAQPGRDRCIYRARLNRKDITIRQDGKAIVVQVYGDDSVLLDDLSLSRLEQPKTVR